MAARSTRDIFYHRYAPAQARHGYAHHHAVLQIWNDYLLSSLYVSTNRLKTMTVAIQSLFSQQSSDYSTAFAAIVISVLPIAILFISLQKYFIKGMTVGAVKG